MAADRSIFHKPVISVGAIAALMPEAVLSARHQAVVDMVVTDKPRPADYRRAAASLARRADASY